MRKRNASEDAPRSKVPQALTERSPVSFNSCTRRGPADNVMVNLLDAQSNQVGPFLTSESLEDTCWHRPSDGYLSSQALRRLPVDLPRVFSRNRFCNWCSGLRAPTA